MKENNYNWNIKYYSKLFATEFLEKIKLPATGLNHNQIINSRKLYGSNTTFTDNKNSKLRILFRAFVNPFSIVLFILAVISLVIKIFYPENNHSSYSTVIIIITTIFLSGIIRFYQELHSKKL